MREVIRIYFRARCTLLAEYNIGVDGLDRIEATEGLALARAAMDRQTEREIFLMSIQGINPTESEYHAAYMRRRERERIEPASLSEEALEAEAKMYEDLVQRRMREHG